MNPHEFISPLYICVPFVVLLVCIAIMPLAVPHFWEKNRNKAIVAAIVSAPVFLFLLFSSPAALWQTIAEYVSFIVLLGSLFVISGGILVTGDLRATPLVTTTFLLIGAVIANLIRDHRGEHGVDSAGITDHS